MTTQLQLKGMVKARFLSSTRQTKNIPNLFLPVLLVLYGILINSIVQSIIPSGPQSSVQVPLELAKLPLNGALGVISNQAQKDILVNVTLEALSKNGRPDLNVEHYDSVNSYQKHLTASFKNSSSNITFAALSYPTALDMEPDSNGKLSFKYDILVESSQPFHVLPLVTRLGEAVKQYFMKGSRNLEFADVIWLRKFDGVDVSLTILPNLLVFGFLSLTPAFAELRVEEYELGQFDFLSVMGLKVSAFYASAFLIDFFIYFLNLLVILVVMAAFQFQWFVDTNILNWALILINFGPAMIILSYLLALLFKKKETARMFLFFLVIFVLYLPTVLIQSFLGNQLSPALHLTLTALAPFYGLSSTVRVNLYLT
jgi:hypothetical protein